VNREYDVHIKYKNLRAVFNEHNDSILHLLHIQERLEAFIDISTHNSHLALGIATSNEVCNWSDVTQ
jgi:hypothetical protein